MSALKFSTAKRRAIRSSNEAVRIGPLFAADEPQMLIECCDEALDLAGWSAANWRALEEMLKKGGALLFRGFAAGGQEGLEKFARAIGMQLMHYMEGATPRRSLGNNVYTSTEFPPDQTIALHNENSYVMSWPMKVCFCCVVAPESQGETPIADVRKILKRIHPEIWEEFARKQYMLVRNFSEHLGLPWETSFKVSSREELEQYCQRARVQPEWQSEKHLTTRQIRPATAVHPHTGEEVWFNHIAFWHSSSLEPSVREVLLSEFGEAGLPYNTYYGDGSRIEPEVVAELRQAYGAETLKFPWKEGDLLLLDNMLMAHGRSPYSGPRKIIVSMGDPFTRTDI